MMLKYSLSKEYAIYYPETGILKNKNAITDPALLEELNKQLLIRGYTKFYSELKNNPDFDQKYLQSLHRTTFHTLYEFAGEYRNQDISKGGSVFCKAIYIQPLLTELFGELRKENNVKDFFDKPIDIFAQRIAYYMGELIAIHPF